VKSCTDGLIDVWWLMKVNVDCVGSMPATSPSELSQECIPIPAFFPPCAHSGQIAPDGQQSGFGKALTAESQENFADRPKIIDMRLSGSLSDS
jgi:hypothetical protein